VSCGVLFVGIGDDTCGVVWCGVVWCGVVWCGVVRCGVGAGDFAKYCSLMVEVGDWKAALAMAPA
jgi:hypothetical protein